MSSKEEKIHEIGVHKRISKQEWELCVIYGGMSQEKSAGPAPSPWSSSLQMPTYSATQSGIFYFSPRKLIKGSMKSDLLVTVISSLSLLQLGLSYNSAHLILLQDYWSPWGGQSHTGSLLSPLGLVFETLYEVPPSL